MATKKRNQKNQKMDFQKRKFWEPKTLQAQAVSPYSRYLSLAQETMATVNNPTITRALKPQTPLNITNPQAIT